METVEIKERKEDLKRELNRIVNVIIHNYSPDKIILFGSLANGNIREWSDIDLVIIKETSERFIDRIGRINSIVDSNVGVDFIVYTPTEFEEMIEDDNYFIIDEVLQKGKVLYERDKQMV